MPRVLGTTLAVITLLCSPPTQAETSLGVKLPARSKALTDGRYELKLGYDQAVAHFKRVLKRAKVPFDAQRRIHRASVKYTHFHSLVDTTQWEHINVSSYDGGVFVRILPRMAVERELKAGRESSNGRTTDSDSVDLGSNPSSRTTPR